MEEASYSDIVFPLIDHMKICGLDINNADAVKMWFDSEDIVLDDHDFGVIFDYLKSSSSSIEDYLSCANETLHCLNSKLNAVFSELETIVEVVETTESQVKIQDTEQLSQNGNETESTIPLSTNPPANEYESVSMIQIKRLPSSLTSFHRYIFFNIDFISVEIQDSLIASLQEEEGDNSYIIAYYLADKHPQKQSPQFFPCKLVLCTVWQLQSEVESAGESALFSSWKTKVNRVCEGLLNAKPIGFVDITNQGIYMYS